MFIKKYTLLVLPFLFILSGCGLNRASVPTPLPTYTQPSSPTSPPATETALPTSTAEFVATATNIATATPPPVCHVGETIESATNGSLPSYIDIVKVLLLLICLFVLIAHCKYNSLNIFKYN